MENKRREFLLKVGVGVVAGLFLLDRMVLSPAIAGWKTQSDRLAALSQKVQRGRQLLEREKAIRGRWDEMLRTDMSDDSSAAENEVIKGINRWAINSRVAFTSMTFTPWRIHDEGYETYECRATATGDQASLGRLLYEIETDALPAHVEECEMTTRDAQGKAITLSLRFSFVRIAEAGRAGK